MPENTVLCFVKQSVLSLSSFMSPDFWPRVYFRMVSMLSSFSCFLPSFQCLSSSSPLCHPLSSFWHLTAVSPSCPTVIRERLEDLFFFFQFFPFMSIFMTYSNNLNQVMIQLYFSRSLRAEWIMEGQSYRIRVAGHLTPSATFDRMTF